jgi:hypothetical protein
MNCKRWLLAIALGHMVGVANAADAPLKVFSPGELPLAHYTVVKRLWVEMPESAFYVRTHTDSGAAISALVNEATRIGADGVVNLHCLNGGQFTANWAGWYCYGNAIKMK